MFRDPRRTLAGVSRPGGGQPPGRGSAARAGVSRRGGGQPPGRGQPPGPGSAPGPGQPPGRGGPFPGQAQVRRERPGGTQARRAHRLKIREEPGPQPRRLRNKLSLGVNVGLDRGRLSRGESAVTLEVPRPGHRCLRGAFSVNTTETAPRKPGCRGRDAGYGAENGSGVTAVPGAPAYRVGSQRTRGRRCTGRGRGRGRAAAKPGSAVTGVTAAAGWDRRLRRNLKTQAELDTASSATASSGSALDGANRGEFRAPVIEVLEH